MKKILLGISSCLLGNNVRYDGQHKKNAYITDTLSKYFDWVAVCPEVEFGLSVPREPMRLINTDNGIRLKTIKSGVDYTEGLVKWSEERINELALLDISGYIFKSRSPSSAIYDAVIYNEKGAILKKGPGIFGKVFLERLPHLPVIDDGRLNNQKLRVIFFNKVFCYRRWQDFIRDDASIAGLINFHTKHKLLLMSYSPKHYTLLGKLVAHPKDIDKKELFDQYFRLFMEALSLNPTAKKNINVLMHCIGYFKKYLSHDEKEEFNEVLEHYRTGYYPLSVPLILIKHYARKYNVSYLLEQYYLNPLPLELTI